MPLTAMTSERLCSGQPDARTPRAALQNAGSGFDLHQGSAVAAGPVGADCAPATLAMVSVASFILRMRNPNRRIIDLHDWILRSNSTSTTVGYGRSSSE